MDSSGGLQELWLVVPAPEVVIVTATGRVPDAPPDSLAAAVEPHLGPDGAVVEWRLTDPTVAAEYWAWRRDLEHRHPVGTARELAVLRSIAATVGHGEQDVLDRLLADLVAAGDEPRELPAGMLSDAVDALLDVRTALEVTGGHGAGLFDPAAPTGRPLRVWSPPVESYVLSATTTTVIHIDPIDGLAVDRIGDDRQRIPAVESVDLAADPVEVVGAGGRTVYLSPAEARPLAWVAPSTLRWVVRPIPLVDVWAHAFESIPIAARTATQATVLASTLSAST